MGKISNGLKFFTTKKNMTLMTFNRAIYLLTILCLVSTECDGLNEVHAKFDKFLRLIGAVVEWDKSLVVELLGQGADPNIDIQYGMINDNSVAMIDIR